MSTEEPFPTSVVLNGLPAHAPHTAEYLLAQVNSLETERLHRMHPDNLRELTEAGVFRLAMLTTRCHAA